jgi:hypothetical protein
MEHPEPNEPREARSRFLSVMLTVMTVGFFLMVLMILTGGLVLYLLAVVAGLTGLVLVHYLLWGRAMTEEMAGEIEEEQLRDQARDDGWPLPDEHRRRY